MLGRGALACFECRVTSHAIACCVHEASHFLYGEKGRVKGQIAGSGICPVFREDRQFNRWTVSQQSDDQNRRGDDARTATSRTLGVLPVSSTVLLRAEVGR